MAISTARCSIAFEIASEPKAPRNDANFFAALFFVIVFLAAPLFASSKERGTSAANFLKIHPGARAAALGGSFVGMPEDLYAAYYNPAGLASLKAPQLAASHLAYFQDIRFNYLGFAFPFRNTRHALGFSITSLGVDGIEKRTSDQDTPESKFSAADTAYQASYGLRLTETVAAGAGVKAVREVIDSESASALAVDAGFYWKRSLGPLRGFGVSLRHLGTGMKFREESDPLPAVLAFGTHALFFKDRLSALADLSLPRDNDPYGSLGLEYSMPLRGGKSALAFRGGYSTFIQKVSGTANISAGVGFYLDPFAFDFAWVPYGDLGSTFRYSLLVRF